MPSTLEALLRLQSIEHQAAEVRRRLKMRRAALAAQQERIQSLQEDGEGLRQEYISHQKDAAAVELELEAREQDVMKLRGSLNIAKTNKEYAAILTQINTFKADNSKLEDRGLSLIQATEELQGRIEQLQRQIEEGQQSLAGIQQNSSDEITRLEAMLEELQGKRDAAAAEVPPKALAAFNHIAASTDGDAMAKIEIVGDKPPHEYVCGGCNMSIRAEHANALRTRDEVRLCDYCQRILYLADATISSHKA